MKYFTPQLEIQNSYANTDTSELTALVSTDISTSTMSAFLEPTMTDGGAITDDIGTVIGQNTELNGLIRTGQAKERWKDGISRKNISISANI